MNIFKAVKVFFCLIFFLLSSIIFAQKAPITLTAVGFDANNSMPLLAVSNDGNGKLWQVKLLPGWSTSAWFHTSSCVGVGTSAVCLAGGSVAIDEKPGQPLFYVSTDGGDNWELKSVPGLAVDMDFKTSDCTGGSGPASFCVAAGVTELTNIPTLITSSDGGNTWSKQSVTGLTGEGYFSASSCSGAGKSAVCAVLGFSANNNNPYLAVTNDGGTSWKNKSIPGLPKLSSYSAIKCTGNGAAATCMVTGSYFGNSSTPLLALSVDGGNTWALQNIKGLPSSSSLSAISCTGEGSSAVCVIAGYFFKNFAPLPLLVVSENGGKNWEVKSSADFPAGGMFNRVSCTGSGKAAVCGASGNTMQDSTETGLFAVSNDGGVNWKMKTLPKKLTNANISSVRCSGEGSATICTLLGDYYFRWQQPLLVISTDAGETWAEQYISGLSSQGEFFEGGVTA